jgi:hypothetical protein
MVKVLDSLMPIAIVVMMIAIAVLSFPYGKDSRRLDTRRPQDGWVGDPGDRLPRRPPPPSPPPS